MSVVDDYGRFYGSPLTVRGACWPTCPEKVSDVEIRTWIAECVSGDNPLITLYEVNGVKYLLINDFNQQRRTKSKFPQPEINLISDCQQNDCTSRSRISESKSEAEPDPVPAIIRESGTDNPFRDLAKVYAKYGKPTSTRDWENAARAAISAGVSDSDIRQKVIPYVRDELGKIADPKRFVGPENLFSRTPFPWVSHKSDLDGIWSNLPTIKKYVPQPGEGPME